MRTFFLFPGIFLFFVNCCAGVCMVPTLEAEVTRSELLQASVYLCVGVCLPASVPACLRGCLCASVHASMCPSVQARVGLWNSLQAGAVLAAGMPARPTLKSDNPFQAKKTMEKSQDVRPYEKGLNEKGGNCKDSPFPCLKSMWKHKVSTCDQLKTIKMLKQVARPSFRPSLWAHTSNLNWAYAANICSSCGWNPSNRMRGPQIVDTKSKHNPDKVYLLETFCINLKKMFRKQSKQLSATCKLMWVPTGCTHADQETHLWHKSTIVSHWHILSYSRNESKHFWPFSSAIYSKL